MTRADDGQERAANAVSMPTDDTPNLHPERVAAPPLPASGGPLTDAPLTDSLAADPALAPPRARPSSPAALLRQLGLRPRKGLSQSFLTDESTVKRIAGAAGLSSDDQVLEIGPGLGILTQELARQAGRVVAFELDRDLAAVLPRLVPPNVRIVQGDALTLVPADYLDGPYKLVANLPYQITSPFLFRYLNLDPLPQMLVVMIQREVAERIVAPVGQLSYLAVMVQSVASVRIVRIVPAAAFHPRPKVESAVIKLVPLDESLVPMAERSAFLGLVRAGFGQPRKTVLNSLHEGLKREPLGREAWERSQVQDLLAAAGIPPELRPHVLTLPQWRALFNAFQELGR